MRRQRARTEPREGRCLSPLLEGHDHAEHADDGAERQEGVERRAVEKKSGRALYRPKYCNVGPRPIASAQLVPT